MVFQLLLPYRSQYPVSIPETLSVGIYNVLYSESAAPYCTTLPHNNCKSLWYDEPGLSHRLLAVC